MAITINPGTAATLGNFVIGNRQLDLEEVKAQEQMRQYEKTFARNVLEWDKTFEEQVRSTKVVEGQNDWKLRQGDRALDLDQQTVDINRTLASNDTRRVGVAERGMSLEERRYGDERTDKELEQARQRYKNGVDQVIQSALKISPDSIEQGVDTMLKDPRYAPTILNSISTLPNLSAALEAQGHQIKPGDKVRVMPLRRPDGSLTGKYTISWMKDGKPVFASKNGATVEETPSEAVLALDAADTVGLLRGGLVDLGVSDDYLNAQSVRDAYAPKPKGTMETFTEIKNNTADVSTENQAPYNPDTASPYDTSRELDRRGGVTGLHFSTDDGLISLGSGPLAAYANNRGSGLRVGDYMLGVDERVDTNPLSVYVARAPETPPKKTPYYPTLGQYQQQGPAPVTTDALDSYSPQATGAVAAKNLGYDKEAQLKALAGKDPSETAAELDRRMETEKIELDIRRGDRESEGWKSFVAPLDNITPVMYGKAQGANVFKRIGKLFETGVPGWTSQERMQADVLATIKANPDLAAEIAGTPLSQWGEREFAKFALALAYSRGKQNGNVTMIEDEINKLPKALRDFPIVGRVAEQLTAAWTAGKQIYE